MKRNLPITEHELNIPTDVNILSTASPKGIITHVNDQFLAISGFSLDELINKNHNIVRHPDVPEAVFQHMWDTIQGNKSWMNIVKNRAKNGDAYWVDAYVTPIERNGKIVEFQSIRRKPKPEYVKRADALFKSINAEKKHPAFKRTLSFGQRLLAVLAGGAAALIAGALYFDLNSSALLGLIAILTAVGGGVWFTLKPLLSVIRFAHTVIDNPSARFIYTGRNDDIGQLWLAYRALEAETAGLIGRMADSSQILQNSAQDLTNTVNSTSQGIEKQFAETEQISSAVTQMSASIHEVATRAQEASDVMDKSQKQIHTSQQQVQVTVQSLHALVAELENTTGVVNEVQKSSEAIVAMLDIINAVSEQTNLLALNAAIEAARAGDAGRGFAVVADEVRQLASRTRASTDEIQHIIDTLREHSTQAVNAMSKGHEQADICLNKGNAALTTLEDVCHTLATISNMNVSVAAAMEEQGIASDVISSSMDNIRTMSEQNLAAEHVSLKATEQVLSVTSALSSLTDNFWKKSRDKITIDE